MHDGIYTESELEVAARVQDLLTAKKKKRRAQTQARIKELKEQWKIRRQKEIDRAEEIDKIRINDYGIENLIPKKLLFGPDAAMNGELRLANDKLLSILGKIEEESDGMLQTLFYNNI